MERKSRYGNEDLRENEKRCFDWIVADVVGKLRWRGSLGMCGCLYIVFMLRHDRNLTSQIFKFSTIFVLMINQEN